MSNFFYTEALCGDGDGGEEEGEEFFSDNARDMFDDEEVDDDISVYTTCDQLHDETTMEAVRSEVAAVEARYRKGRSTGSIGGAGSGWDRRWDRVATTGSTSAIQNKKQVLKKKKLVGGQRRDLPKKMKITSVFHVKQGAAAPTTIADNLRQYAAKLREIVAERPDTFANAAKTLRKQA